MNMVSSVCTDAISQIEATANVQYQELSKKEECIKDLTQFLIYINNHTKDGKLDLTSDPVALEFVDKIKAHSPEIFSDNLDLSEKEVDLVKENSRHLQKTYDIDVSSMQKHLQHSFDIHKTVLDIMRKIHDTLDQMNKEMAKVGKS